MKEQINEIVQAEVWLAELLEQIKQEFNIIYFGGIVRDILYGCNTLPRDIDIVLYPLERKQYGQDYRLEKIITQDRKIECYSVNRFGGYKLTGKKLKVDIWLLKNTWAFQQKILSASPDNLLKSVYLNIDAYAWDSNSESFIGQCDAYNIKEIDIVLEKNPYEYLNLIRAVHFSDKYQIPLSEQVKSKLRDMLQGEKDGQRLFDKIQMEHYGNIMVSYKDLCKRGEGR